MNSLSKDPSITVGMTQVSEQLLNNIKPLLTKISRRGIYQLATHRRLGGREGEAMSRARKEKVVQKDLGDVLCLVCGGDATHYRIVGKARIPSCDSRQCRRKATLHAIATEEGYTLSELSAFLQRSGDVGIRGAHAR